MTLYVYDEVSLFSKRLYYTSNMLSASWAEEESIVEWQKGIVYADGGPLALQWRDAVSSDYESEESLIDQLKKSVFEAASAVRRVEIKGIENCQLPLWVMPEEGSWPVRTFRMHIRLLANTLIDSPDVQARICSLKGAEEAMTLGSDLNAMFPELSLKPIPPSKPIAITIGELASDLKYSPGMRFPVEIGATPCLAHLIESRGNDTYLCQLHVCGDIIPEAKMRLVRSIEYSKGGKSTLASSEMCEVLSVY